MSQHPAASIPQVYVLWHPDCSYGERLAQRILRWLRPGNGLGPEVFYRSLPRPGAMRTPPDLPDPSHRTSSGQKRVSNLQVVVVLLEEHMVADWSWRHWIDEAGRHPRTERAIMPVALDATAYNVPARLRDLNYLRPAGLPQSLDSPLDDATFEVVARSLLKQLTEAMCRLILPRPVTAGPAAAESPAAEPTSNAPLPKVNVFLSHAKVDGTVPARRLRDYIYSQTQLTAFYDENDIAFGEAFGQIIRNMLASNDTAAMIAVRSQKYASRPWCRRELSIFRQPQPEDSKDQPEKARRWRLYPSLIVEAMEGSQISPGIPETGNSTIIRWADDAKDLEELIVTTVIRDAMLAAFHSTLGASILSNSTSDGQKHRLVINWLPDAISLLSIQAVRSGETRELLYPGRGLSGMELDTLKEFFPKLELISFEDALLESPGELLL